MFPVILCQHPRRARLVAAPVACAALALALPRKVQGEEPSATTQACMAAYESVQDLRADGKLRAAKSRAIECARAACPEALVKDCRQWLDQINLSLPSVVFDVRNRDGDFVAETAIYVDGERIADKLEGRAVAVDPGVHRIRAESASHQPTEMQIVVQEGQRNQKVAIVVAGQSSVDQSDSGVEDVPDGERPVPAAAWVFGGVSVVGLVVGGAFLGVGLAKREDLDACRPNCAGGDVDAMMRYLVVGDIALAAGVVSAAAALTIYLTRPATSSTSRARTILALQPLPEGLSAVVGASF